MAARQGVRPIQRVRLRRLAAATCPSSAWPTCRCNPSGRPDHRRADRAVDGRDLRRGRQELVDRHAALQLPVHRPAVLPDPGTAGSRGSSRDAAYQGTTTEFWGSMEAVGEQTYVLGGAFNCGKGQPGQVAPVSHGCPSALFRQVRILNTGQEAAGERRASPQELIERALELSRADACVVIGDEVERRQPAVGQQHPDDQRRHRRNQLTVIAISDGAGRRWVPRGGDFRVARGPGPAPPRTRPARRPEAEDAAPLVDGRPARPGTPRRPRPPSGVFGRFAPLSARRSPGPPRAARCCSDTPSTRCAPPTWRRRRACGPATTNRPATWRSTPSRRTSPARPGPASPTAIRRRRRGRLTRDLSRRLAWAARRIELPAGRYETILPPSAVADLMIDLYWSAGAATPTTAGRCSAGPAEGPGSANGSAEEAVTLRSDPAAPFLQCSPFVMAPESSGADCPSSTTACPLRRPPGSTAAS